MRVVLGRRPVGVLEPDLLPEDPALRLAAAVTGPVATGLVEQDRFGHPPAAGLLTHVVADLLEPPVDRHRATGVLGHLRHEGDLLVGPGLVKGLEDLVERAQAHPVAGSQRPGLGRPPGRSCRDGHGTIEPYGRQPRKATTADLAQTGYAGDLVTVQNHPQGYTGVCRRPGRRATGGTWADEAVECGAAATGLRSAFGPWPIFEVRTRSTVGRARLRATSRERREVRRLGRRWSSRRRSSRRRADLSATRVARACRPQRTGPDRARPGRGRRRRRGGVPPLPDDERLVAVSLARNTGRAGVCATSASPCPVRTYLAFLDDDNEWRPHHLDTALGRCRTGVDLVYTGVERVRPDGTCSTCWRGRSPGKRSGSTCFVDTNSIVVRRGPGVRFSRLHDRDRTSRRRTGSSVWRLSRRLEYGTSPKTVTYLVNPESYFTTGVTDQPAAHTRRCSTMTSPGSLVVSRGVEQKVWQASQLEFEDVVAPSTTWRGACPARWAEAPGTPRPRRREPGGTAART